MPSFPVRRRVPALLAGLVAALVAPLAAAQPAGVVMVERRTEPFPAAGFVLAPDRDIPRPRAEAIQGKPNFVKVNTLMANDPNSALSSMVGQLYISRDGKYYPHCTAFLIGSNLMLTNYHCVADYEKHTPYDPRTLIVSMEHLEEGKHGPQESFAFVVGTLKLDLILDYALISVDKPIGERYGWLTLETDPAAVAATRAVKIIQHPAGRSKEIVLEDTEMVQQTPLVLHYLADTEGGSSGSPVFDLAGSRVIGLHHAGTNRYNEGFSMARIAAEIAFYLPQPAEAQTAPAAAAPAAPVAAASAAGAPAAAGATATAARAARPASVLDLLLAPPSPMTDAESKRPLRLGVGAPVDAGAAAPAQAPKGGAATPAQGGGAAKIDW